MDLNCRSHYLANTSLLRSSALLGSSRNAFTPLTAAHTSWAIFVLKVTNEEQVSIFSRYLKTNMADLSSEFSKVCEKFELSD